MTARTLAALTALLPVLFFTACGGDSEKIAPPTATSAAATSAAATTAPATQAATQAPAASPTTGAFNGSTAPVQATPASNAAGIQVVDLRAAAHPGFDRLVFEFSGNQVPGYSVQYATTAVACGSGQDLTSYIGGGSPPAAMLMVKIEPADAHDQSSQPTIVRDLQANLATIIRAFGICDFEAHVDYAVALSAQKPFQVTTLANPPRLVIDVAQ